MWQKPVLFTLLGVYIFAHDNTALLAQHLKNLERVQALKIKRLASKARLSKIQKDPEGTRKLLQTARSYLGVHYQYGGETRKGIDCSAFVRNVYKKTVNICRVLL